MACVGQGKSDALVFGSLGQPYAVDMAHFDDVAVDERASFFYDALSGDLIPDCGPL